jgi:hypothetical protein
MSTGCPGDLPEGMILTPGRRGFIVKKSAEPQPWPTCQSAMKKAICGELRRALEAIRSLIRFLGLTRQDQIQRSLGLCQHALGSLQLIRATTDLNLAYRRMQLMQWIP